MKYRIHLLIEKVWYTKNIFSYVLWPISIFFQLITKVRRWYLEIFKQKSFSVPVIVVGNISVGGVGKTPLVVAIAEKFTTLGVNIAIVSRGYGADNKKINFPYL